MAAAALPRTEPWPEFSYPAFASTQHLLHMGLQAIGKLKLHEPFLPQWAGVPFWLTARGLTTGPLSHAGGVFEVNVDLLADQVNVVTSEGRSEGFPLTSMSVARFVELLLDLLRRTGVDVPISLAPQEVADTTPFDRDTLTRTYDPALARAWWRILLSTRHVMQVFEGRFQGKTHPAALMWGTLDIRMALYNGKPASPGANVDYIRRNAMNAELVEFGWWSGSPQYPKAAFYAFTFPEPPGIADAAINPRHARWDKSMGEFILDYDDLRASSDPDGDLLAFFQSAYLAGATRAGWDPSLLGSGAPT